MAEPAREAAPMIGWLTRLLKIDERQPYDHEADASVTEVRVNLAELEQSQLRLKRAVEDTGFFLGDAMVRRQHDRPRAVHHDS